MSPTKLVWGIIAAVCAIVVVAVVMRVSEQSAGERVGSGDALVALRENAAKIDRIEVSSGDKSALAQRSADGWTLASKQGFKANDTALQEVVRGLISLTKSQRMTAKPQRHAELGVNWPDPSGSARLVRLFVEGSQDPLVEVVIGRSVSSPTGVYARMLGDDQAWRCTGTFPGGADSGAWISGPISDIQADSIASIDALPINGLEGIQVARVNGQWTVTPEDPRADALKSTLPYLLSGFQPEDVRREVPEDLARPDSLSLAIRLDAQHTVDARLWKEGDAIWVRIAPGECGSEANEALDKFSPGWAGWVFKLPAWKAGQWAPLFLPSTATSTPTPETPVSAPPAP